MGVVITGGLLAALVWRVLVGRAARRVLAALAGAAAPLPDVLLDLAAGLLSGWFGLLAWSAFLKRAAGLACSPAATFAVIELALVLLAWWRTRSTLRCPSATRVLRFGQLARLAAFLALVFWLASGDPLTPASGSGDQDQHIAWTLDVARAGHVPDVAVGTETALAYPLGFHALAVATSAQLVPAVAALNVLPLLTGQLLVWVVCGLARRLAGADDRVEHLVAEVVASAGIGLALFSGHFSVWPTYLVIPRQAAGLCQIVPLTVLLMRPAHASPAEAPEPPRMVAVSAAALPISVALAATLNPTLVPLQLIMCGLAALALTFRRGRSGFVSAVTGVAAGLALSLAVLGADPYLGRLAHLPGLRPAPAPYLSSFQADFTAHLQGRSCLTPRCLWHAAVSATARRVALDPWRVLLLGPVDLVLHGPAPDRYDVPALGRIRFPDITGVGLAPLHGRATPYVLAFLLPLFLARILAARHRPLALAGLALGAALALDALMRGILRAAIDPGDATWRLLPYYADSASALAFGQVLWTVLLMGVLFGGSSRAPDRSLRRTVAGVTTGLLLAVGAAPDVKLGMAWGRVVDLPSWTDLSSLSRLEAAHVPRGESWLVAARVVDEAERWVQPSDPAVLFYLHAERPSLFLYFLDDMPRYGPSGLTQTCEALAAGAPPALLLRHRARWAIASGPPPAALDAMRRRTLCGRPFAEWFPQATVVASQGRVSVIRLWPDLPSPTR